MAVGLSLSLGVCRYRWRFGGGRWGCGVDLVLLIDVVVGINVVFDLIPFRMSLPSLDVEVVFDMVLHVFVD